MLHSAAIVILLVIAGDVVAETLSLPVPGAAIGLVMLTCAFAIRGGPDKGAEDLFDLAAPYFPLFFVPAAVGVIASLEMLSSNWAVLLLAIIAGTALTLTVTGTLFQALLRRSGQEAETCPTRSPSP